MILLKKLEMYGIRGVAFDWIKSYIENRLQFVQMGQRLIMIIYLYNNITCGGQYWARSYLFYVSMTFADLLRY